MHGGNRRNPYEIQVNTKAAVRSLLKANKSDEGRNPYEIQVNTKQFPVVENWARRLRRNPYEIQVNTKC